MALAIVGLLLAALAALLVWRVAERFWHIVAIAILAVPLMPLFAVSVTGDVSRYLPDWLDADKDGVIVASVAATLLLAVIVATGVFGIAKLVLRGLRGSTDR